MNPSWSSGSGGRLAAGIRAEAARASARAASARGLSRRTAPYSSPRRSGGGDVGGLCATAGAEPSTRTMAGIARTVRRYDRIDDMLVSGLNVPRVRARHIPLRRTAGHLPPAATHTWASGLRARGRRLRRLRARRRLESRRGQRTRGGVRHFVRLERRCDGERWRAWGHAVAGRRARRFITRAPGLLARGRLAGDNSARDFVHGDRHFHVPHCRRR